MRVMDLIENLVAIHETYGNIPVKINGTVYEEDFDGNYDLCETSRFLNRVYSSCESRTTEYPYDFVDGVRNDVTLTNAERHAVRMNMRRDYWVDKHGKYAYHETSIVLAHVNESETENHHVMKIDDVLPILHWMLERYGDSVVNVTLKQNDKLSYELNHIFVVCFDDEYTVRLEHSLN